MAATAAAVAGDELVPAVNAAAFLEPFVFLETRYLGAIVSSDFTGGQCGAFCERGNGDYGPPHDTAKGRMENRKGG